MKILLFVFLCFSFHNKLYAQEQWKSYPYQDLSSDIIFPDDEGRHNLVTHMEWWYAVMHLEGKETKNKYSVLVSHFNNQIRFFTITNRSTKKHSSGTTLGILNSAKGHLDLRHRTIYGTDLFKSKRDSNNKLIPFNYQIKTHYKKMFIDVELSAIKRPLMVQGDGYVDIGTSGKSWYYSLTRLDVSGKISHDGIEEEVAGMAWMDHQWGPFIVSPIEIGNLFESYEWFCLQLDDGTDIMISNIFDRDNNLPETPEYGGVDISRPDGTSITVHDKEFIRTSYWQDPQSGKFMSMGWNLNIPSEGLNLSLAPFSKNQMVNLPLGGSFWEGALKVTGTINGEDIKGKGFGELIHRYQLPKIKFYSLDRSYHVSDEVNIKWSIENKDEGNPLQYKLELITESGKSFLLVDSLKVNKYLFKLGQLENAEKLKSFQLSLTAYSVDKVISNSKLSKRIEIIQN
ncbi:MAG: hypothetical protein HOJ35_10295 [Bdellovibrionales bacterium]|nr:hypothetical protein [Bdellovibrionales bacterium]